ncbi:MAG: hypothetical protein RMY29_004330 [Nostoc sp. CreGUA01]
MGGKKNCFFPTSPPPSSPSSPRSSDRRKPALRLLSSSPSSPSSPVDINNTPYGIFHCVMLGYLV